MCFIKCDDLSKSQIVDWYFDIAWEHVMFNNAV